MLGVDEWGWVGGVDEWVVGWMGGWVGGCGCVRYD